MGNSLTSEAIAELLQPYIQPPPVEDHGYSLAPIDWAGIYKQLAQYLELILKWNARINLTAIRTPEEIVQRHFGESLFVGLRLGSCTTLLDFGSGAGFPGVPIQIARPDVEVTLAESRSKKAAFLQEVVRALDIRTAVWSHRVETMQASRRFHTVTLRAVDDMDSAVLEAGIRATARVLILGTCGQLTYPGLIENYRMEEPIPIPGSDEGVLLTALRRAEAG